MNSPETQSDSSSQESYFDPEVMDTSEQEFSASLERSDQPSFIVDSPDNLPAKATENQDVERMASRPSQTQGHSEIAGNEPTHSDWRDQVSAKVKHYKTLKPRKERYPSLQLQFDTVVPWKSEKPSLAAEREQFFAASRADSPSPNFEPEQHYPYPASNEATARVLEFPRPGMLPFNRDELAEPVIDRPRIMEAPELLPPPPALGGMLIEPVSQPEPERQPGIDMPLQTAPLSRRIFAAAVDGLVITGAIAIFGYMFLRFNPSLPQIRMTAEVAAALTVTLWFAYQSAFLIFCGTTPGLRATRLKISRFDGTPASRDLRRWRVVASGLSFVSLGLGYVWTFLDEDQLSWHDRITKTHLAPRK
jgi:uncharacterized RDD family membrane protein YckC